MKSLGLFCAFIVGAVSGCSLPLIGDGASAPTSTAIARDSVSAGSPIVQVRGYWRSSTISVVAWDENDAAFGLRATISRRGELVGGLRFGDHRLYMTPLYASDMGGFAHAAVTPGQPLLPTGAQRDYYSCFYGRPCSPMLTIGLRVPDSLLRADRDSIVVTFFPRVRDSWTITLRRELIAAYLRTVDSVQAEVRKTAAM